MDKNKVIIAVLIVIILALIAGIFIIIQKPSKEISVVKITSEDSLYEGDSLKVQLSDANGTAIANQNVNITLTDNDKTSQYYSVVTNSEGIGELKLDKSPGKYTVNCTYGGNENYTGNSTLQRLEILEVVAAEESSSSSSDDGLPDVDASGITREEAEKYGWTYTPEHGGHYIGSHDAWDEEAGVYHD